MSNPNLKAVFSGFYDLQKMRIQAGNRIVANHKIKLGQAPGEREEELDDDAKKLLVLMRESYDSITAAVAADFGIEKSKKRGKRVLPSPVGFIGHGVISDYAELILVAMYLSLIEEESKYTLAVRDIVHAEPFWKHWLEGVTGVGEIMALVILSSIDIHKAKYPSSLWKYCGVDVAHDGKGRSRKAEHLVERDYIDKEGKPAKRMGVTFNPTVKTKLLGVLGPSFLRAGDNKYSAIYRDYKHRLEHHAVYGLEKKPGHRHNMAMRYAVKMFLLDLYVAWREFEGLEVSAPYHEAKLGMKHGPKVSSNPDEASEPEHSRQPQLISDPEKRIKPSVLSEPSTASKPDMISEPSTCMNPIKESEPYSSSNPAELSEPKNGRKPTTASEPISSSNPNGISEPISNRKPAPSSEPDAPPADIAAKGEE